MMTARSIEALAEAAESRAGPGTVRPGTAADAIDEVVPRLIVEPPDAERIATTLAWAGREKLRVVVRGGGTKLGWGPPPEAVDLILSTTRLDAVVEHRYGDLTATVQAGAALGRVNRQLGGHGQWIPLDLPWPEHATIGGIVATNESGPRRHRHGAPRDLIIGVGLARADGRLVKAGGIVVKNVAGYDLARLLTGSFGCLAVIVTATFKLAPLAPYSRTVAVDLPALNRVGPLVADLLARQLAPTAVELQLPPPRVLIRFESVEAAAAQQASDAAELAEGHGGKTEVVAGDEERALWEAHARRPWEGTGAVVKLSLLPGDLQATLMWLEEATRTRRVAYELAGRAGLAVLYLRLDGSAEAQAELVTALRGRLPEGHGSAMIMRGAPQLKSLVDVWGPIGDGLRIMREVKSRFDPTGVLNPGRGPGGL